jgi:hypothetical protein
MEEETARITSVVDAMAALLLLVMTCPPLPLVVAEAEARTEAAT